MSNTSKVTDCIFCEAKEIKLHGHVRLCKGLPDSVTTKRFPNLTEQVCRSLAEHVAMMTFGPSGKCYECPFCKVIKNHKGNSEVKKHIKKCFVGNKIYGFVNFDLKVDGSDRLSLAMNCLNSNQTELNDKINNLKSKWKVGEFNDPAFFWMHKYIPIPPAPHGFGSPDVMPHHESPNFAEFDPYNQPTSLIKKKVSPEPQNCTASLPRSSSTQPALESIQTSSRPFYFLEQDKKPIHVAERQELAAADLTQQISNRTRTHDNQIPSCSDSNVQSVDRPSPLSKIDTKLSKLTPTESLASPDDVFQSLTCENIKNIPRNILNQFLARLKQLPDNMIAGTSQEDGFQNSAPVLPKTQDSTVITYGYHGSTASFVTSVQDDVPKDHNFPPVILDSEDSTPVTTGHHEATTSFVTSVQDDVPKAHDSTHVSHDKQDLSPITTGHHEATTSFDISVQDDVPKAHDSTPVSHAKQDSTPVTTGHHESAASFVTSVQDDVPKAQDSTPVSNDKQDLSPITTGDHEATTSFDISVQDDVPKAHDSTPVSHAKQDSTPVTTGHHESAASFVTSVQDDVPKAQDSTPVSNDKQDLSPITAGDHEATTSFDISVQDDVPKAHDSTPVSHAKQDSTPVTTGHHESAASFVTSVQDDVPKAQDSTPVSNDKQDLSPITTGHHEATTSFDISVQGDVPKAHDSTPVSHAKQDSTPVTTGHHESAASFVTSVQDDVPKAQDSTHVSHDKQDSTASFFISVQGDLPKTQNSTLTAKDTQKSRASLTLNEAKKPHHFNVDYDTNKNNSTSTAAEPDILVTNDANKSSSRYLPGNYLKRSHSYEFSTSVDDNGSGSSSHTTEMKKTKLTDFSDKSDSVSTSQHALSVNKLHFLKDMTHQPSIDQSRHLPISTNKAILPSETFLGVKLYRLSNTEIQSRMLHTSVNSKVDSRFKDAAYGEREHSVTKRKRHQSESDSESSAESKSEDDTIEHDSDQYPANPLFAAGNKKYVDLNGKQQDIDSLWTKMAVMGNNYDLEVLYGFGLSLDRLEVNRDGYITGMVLPKSRDLTPTEHLFKIQDSDEGPIYSFRKEQIDTLSEFIAEDDISKFEAAFNHDPDRQLLLNRKQMEFNSDQNDILVENKLTLLEHMLPVNENILQIRERKGLNKRTGSGSNVREFENWLGNDQHRNPRTVELYSRHIRRIMYYVQRKMATCSEKDFETPTDIDLDIVSNSFTTVREYFLKLEHVPLRSCSLKNEWSSYMYLLRFARNKVIDNHVQFQTFERILTLQAAPVSKKYHKEATQEYNTDLYKHFQEGFRWKLKDVLKVINDPLVKKRVKLLNQKFTKLYSYKAESEVPFQFRITLNEKIFFTRWLIFKIVIENFQRPGVAQALTTNEFHLGKWVHHPDYPMQKYYCISVRFHKTGEHKPAQLALSENEYKHMYNYFNLVRPKPRPLKQTKGTKHLKKKSVPGRTEQMFKRCKKFQRKGETDIEFAKRNQQEEIVVEENETPFFLVPTSGVPIRNASTMLRHYLATNLHKNNIIPANSPCWNATVARKLCETCSNYSKELSDTDVNNITRYLNHSSTVAKSHYVIDKPETVINTKTLIKTHVLKMKQSQIITPSLEIYSSSAESVESVPYDGPVDKMVTEFRESFEESEVDQLYFSNLMASTWPPHVNGRVPSAARIMEEIISQDAKSGIYYKCKRNSNAFKIGTSNGHIAYNLNKEYRSWRTELRAQIVADNFKWKPTLNSKEIHEFLKTYSPDVSKPQTPQPKLMKDSGRKKSDRKGQWAGERKHITGPALRLWRAQVKQTESAKDIHDQYFVESHLSDGRWPDIAVIEHAEFGKGVIATSFLPKNRVVCDYHGKFLSKSDLEKLNKSAKQGLDNSEYVLQHSDIIINASEPNPNLPWGSYGRMLNHSAKHPNLKTHLYTRTDKNASPKKVILFVTMKDVDMGEQLTWNYGKKHRKSEYFERCLCNTCFPLDMSIVKKLVDPFSCGGKLENCSSVVSHTVTSHTDHTS